MADVLQQLIGKLQKVYGDRLVSVVLYGSAAAGDHQAGFSDYNVLCVLSRLTPRELEQSEPIFRWWRERGNPAPLLLTEGEVRTCTDCFPIEFHDIRREHRILYGADVIAGLEVDNSFYRARVEYELRAKLLRLRQKASSVLSDRDLLLRLLADSLSTFCVLFRHALRLHGQDGAMKKREIIDQAQAAFGLDATPFQTLLDLREHRVKAREMDPAALLSSYLQGIGAVIDAVDRLEK